MVKLIYSFVLSKAGVPDTKIFSSLSSNPNEEYNSATNDSDCRILVPPGKKYK